MGIGLRRLTYIAVWIALTLPIAAKAQSLSADQRLEAYIRLNQFASPYAGAVFPEQWCYYNKVDKAYSWWYLTNPISGTLGAVEARGGFGIPFISGAYGGMQTTGAVLVGYVIDGGTPTADLESVSSLTPNAPNCAMGQRILMDGPYPIVGLATNIALQSATDPAPEYRLWSLKGTFHRARLISAIPAAFQVDGTPTAGRLIVGFTGDW